MENIIEDLSCNSITIRQQPSCVGSVRFITTPSGANIFIYDDVQRIYIKQSDVVTGSTDNPTIISNIPCTSPIRSNAFRLTLPGYIDEEGILYIESGLTYPLNLTMRQTNPSQMGGLLLFSLAFGAFIFFFSTRKKSRGLSTTHEEK